MFYDTIIFVKPGVFNVGVSSSKLIIINSEAKENRMLEVIIAFVNDVGKPGEKIPNKLKKH